MNNSPHIFSPMATGNGAFVVHKLLSQKIPGYSLHGYNPYWTLVPPSLPFLFKSIIKPGILHTTPDYGSFFTKSFNSLVVTFHNYVLDSCMAPFSSLLQNIHYRTDLRYFTRKSLKRAASVTAVSNFTADLVKKDLHYTGDIQVIYNGIDTNRFFPSQEQRNSSNCIKVLFCGNLTRRKGADLLPLIACRLSKNIKILYTCGLRTKHRLPEHPQLQNIGSVPYSDMPSIYPQADILLFPTVREGLSLAALEAMSCGLPVVATDCSSLPELIIEKRGGYLCRLEDVDDFAQAINTLAESPALRQEMGQFNRERVERLFTMERMVREYRELFEKVYYGI